jgi:hypothetical protein
MPPQTAAAHESSKTADAAASVSELPWLALVAEKVRTLNYGVVQIVVHDSQVVQVERTERHRFDVNRRP